MTALIRRNLVQINKDSSTFLLNAMKVVFIIYNECGRQIDRIKTTL